MGRMLRQAYKVFQMDVGLHGTIFTRRFASLSCLAAKTWFYDLWRLCDHFWVALNVNAENNVPMIRQGDRCLMECFISLGCFDSGQLAVLGSQLMNDCIGCALHAEKKFEASYWVARTYRIRGSGFLESTVPVPAAPVPAVTLRSVRARPLTVSRTVSCRSIYYNI